MDQTFLEQVEKIATADGGRYHPESYAFLMEALSFTQKRLKRERHVSAGELLEGIKDFALRKFGGLAPSVFVYWGVHTTEDFGHIVFTLIEHGILGRQKEDSFESFRNGFDLRETFRRDNIRQLDRAARRIR